jgi:ACS family glucarate transporter-like MFS transporter
LLVLLAVMASAAYICRAAPAALGPQMRGDLHLSDTQLGFVFSAFLLGYTLMQAPTGWLADRVRTRTLFGAIAPAWALLTAATAAVTPLPLLLAVRALFGVAAAPVYPAAARAVALAFPPNVRARANSVVLASVGIGSAITPILLVPFARSYGWRAGMLLAAAVAAVATAAWWFWAPEPNNADARDAAERRRLAGERAGATTPLTHVTLNTRSFWLLCASYFLQAYLGYIFIFWFLTYLVDVRGFALLNAAWVSTLPWLATLVAIPLGGIGSDAAVQRWGATRGRRSLPLIAFLLAAMALVVGARTANAKLAVAALTACTVLVLSTEGPYWAAANQLGGARSGTAGGIMNFAGNAGGVISPALTPWLAARIGWAGALTATAGLALVAAALWFGIELSPRRHEEMKKF